MKFSRSPAWKMTGKHRSTSEPDQPAPNTYQVGKTRPGSPSWKIGNSNRYDYLSKGDGPGPGAYNSASKMGTSYGIIHCPSRKPHDIKKQIVGPGSYNPNYSTTKTTSGAFSMLGKTKEKSADQVPGPGQYELKSTISPSKFNFGTSERKWFHVDKEVPGPGVYSPVQVETKGKGGKIGNEKRCKSAKPSTTLGPGQYLNKSMFDQQGSLTKGFTFSSKVPDTHENQVPGPGCYEPKHPSQVRPTSALKSRTKRFQLKENFVPGPGTYDSRNYCPKNNQSSPSWTYSKQTRQPGVVSCSPGPGAYSIPSELSIFPNHR